MAEQTPQLPSTSVPFVDKEGNITPPWQRVLQGLGYSQIPLQGIIIMDDVTATTLPKTWAIVTVGGLTPPAGWSYVQRIA